MHIFVVPVPAFSSIPLLSAAGRSTQLTRQMPASPLGQGNREDPPPECDIVPFEALSVDFFLLHGTDLPRGTGEEGLQRDWAEKDKL